MKRFEAILFDLDGTLIRLPQKQFSEGTTLLMAQLLAPQLGVETRAFIKALTAGLEAMIANDGSARNDDAFYAAALPGLGGDRKKIDELFNRYYENEFNGFFSLTSENIYVKPALAHARRLADKVVLATLPVFPFSAQKTRLSWIGLTHADFDLVTDYENCRFSKPSAAYYKEILDRYGFAPENCLMVGNDVSDDILPALSLGMKSYLVTDCLLNGHLPCDGAMRGSFGEFTEYLGSL